VHKEHAVKGDTRAERDAKAHFVCYIEKEGNVIELDGRREAPLNKGKIEGKSLGQKASRIIRQYMEMDKGEVKFSVMALCPPTGGMF